jgi:hypothetical protein
LVTADVLDKQSLIVVAERPIEVLEAPMKR